MLQSIQHWMESTYQLEPEIPVSNFLIQHSLLKKYLGENHPLNQAEEVLLILNHAEEIELGLYLHPKFYEKSLSEASLHEILTILEGVSHLLLALHRFRVGETLSQLELELQAEIDKFLFFRMASIKFFKQNAWKHLEKAHNLAGLSDQQKETYKTSRRLAFRYCMGLERKYFNFCSFDGLLKEVRHFYRMSHWKKLKTIGLP